MVRWGGGGEVEADNLPTTLCGLGFQSTNKGR